MEWISPSNGVFVAALALMMIGVIVAAVLPTGMPARGFAKIFPRETPSTIDVEELIGRYATIMADCSGDGSSMRASVTERSGQRRVVTVEPLDKGARFAEGDAVLLVRREGARFRAIGRRDTPPPQR